MGLRSCLDYDMQPACCNKLLEKKLAMTLRDVANFAAAMKSILQITFLYGSAKGNCTVLG